jgi:hypothetical protein
VLIFHQNTKTIAKANDFGRCTIYSPRYGIPASLVIKPLCRVADDLLFQSGTDTPSEPFFRPDVKIEDITPAYVVKLAKALSDASIETTSLEECRSC